MGDVIDISRNAACPCGSGRKYKRCCGRDAPARSPGSGAWQQLRAAEARLATKIWDWATEVYGPEIFDAAWYEFRWCEEDEPLESDSPDFRSYFGPWALFDWTPGIEGEEDDDDTWPARPLSVEFLDSHPDRLDALERRLLETACSRPFSFHQVLRVEPDHGLELRDLLNGETRYVSERNATQSLNRGEILFARTVEIDGTAILLGCAPFAIPPTYASRLLDLRDELAGGDSGGMTIAYMRALEFELRSVYFEIEAQLLDPVLPELRNTDGDPFKLIEQYYALHCSPQHAFEKLNVLAVGHTAADLLADAERDAEGQLLSVEIPWLAKANKQNEHWQNTILGRVVIDRDVLTIEVNSRRRASRIRKRVENRLSGEVSFQREEVASAEELIDAAHSAGSDSAGSAAGDELGTIESDPAMREITERMRREHWERWLDLEVPALDGMTPREAACDPHGRERLEALLLEFEWRSARSPNGLAPDLEALRRELGISSRSNTP